MRRREVLSALASSLVAAPHAVSAQDDKRIRVVVIFERFEQEFARSLLHPSFEQGLRERGWTEGVNLRIVKISPGTDEDSRAKRAAEVLDQKPDVILTAGTLYANALAKLTRDTPIVFTQVTDPVKSGYAETISRPGKNLTGFTTGFENGFGKHAQILKEIAPSIRSIGLLHSPNDGGGLHHTLQVRDATRDTADRLGLTTPLIEANNAFDIERELSKLGSEDGLFVAAEFLFWEHRRIIYRLAIERKIPIIYWVFLNPQEGGLVSYGASAFPQYRAAADYVDRILRGAKPGELPIQSPTTYRLAINLSIARAMGLTVPRSVVALADKVIE